jgi:hypothetical protein
MEESPNDPITQCFNFEEFGYQQLRGCAVLSERCLAGGKRAWSHWKPGLRVAKKDVASYVSTMNKDVPSCVYKRLGETKWRILHS